MTEKPSEWIGQHFYVHDPRDPLTDESYPPGPILLAEHQKRIIDEALSRNEDGTFKYSTIIYSAPKKSGKSALSSAVALYMAYSYPNSYIACVANDGKQADDRLYGPIQTCFRLHNQLGGIFKGIRYTQREAVLGNFTKIEPINVDASSEAGSQPRAVFFCFDEETEILTREGWKSYDEYSVNDEFLTLDQNSGDISYQRPTSIHINYYRGKMYSLDTRHVSLCVSPSHKLYGKRHHSSNKHDASYEKFFVEDILNTSKYAVRVEAGELDELEYVPLEITVPATKRKPELRVPVELYLRFLGWYIAEGCTHKGDTVMLSQSKSSVYYQEILELIQELGYVPHEWEGTKALVFYDSRWAKHLAQFGLAHEKFIPRWVKHLPNSYIDIFLESYWKGDGYKTGAAVEDHNNKIFATSSPRLRDDLMEIAARRGQYVTSTSYQDKRWGRKVYSVNIKPKKSGERSISSWTKKFKTIDYAGYIHCPSVPNGVVCVRRNGKVHWQGQSEIWGYTTPKKLKLFTELTIPPTLYGHAIQWIESYAGFTGESEILEQLYETGFVKGLPHPDFVDLQGRDGPVVRVNESAGMFTYWDTEPRMAWQVPAYYAQQEQKLSPSEFQRIHRNQWVSPASAFVQPEWWDACHESDLPILADGDRTPVVVGIDMAVSRDCAALIAVTRNPFEPASSVAVRGARIFSPKQSGGIIDQEMLIRPVIEDWARRWNVVCWVYDPKEMAKLAQDLSREGLGWFRPFGQVNPRAVSDKQLHDMIMHRQIAWNKHTTYGEAGDRGEAGETLYNHITKAGAVTRNEAYRLEKLSAATHIDAAVALSQAAYIAMQLNIDNREHSEEELIKKLQRREITLEEFSQRVQSNHAKLREYSHE